MLYLDIDRCVRVDLPEQVQNFIDAFDRGDEVEPFEFEFNWP